MLKLRHSLAAALFAASFTGTASVAAQEITVYEHDNFTGRRFAANASVADLANTGFNDRASSVVVRSGSWQVCSDQYYRGRCVTLTSGDYPSLASLGLNDRVSSIRELGWQRDGGRSPGPAAGRIALYDDTNLGGRGITLDNIVANFERIGFNDRANSAVISDGAWELCEHEEFRGTCQIYPPGRYANLGTLTGIVSSARPVAGSGPVGAGDPVGAGGGGWGGRTRVVMYEGPNYSGRMYTVDSNVLRDLGGTGFNDRASSLRVERGYWLFCSEANFQGDCRTFGPGDYPNLPAGLANRISSGRRIANEYPYNQAPTWRDSASRQQ